jgi:GNAT superfamily N-acetyltransferase
MEPSVVSRQGTHQDIEAILDTLVVAFANDPIWGGWAFPERERAAEQRRAFFELWLLGSLRYQTVHVTPGCEAVALWYPPGQFENTPEDERDLVATARTVLGPHADRFLEACEVIETVHPRHEPHYYLSMLGTHDRHRGRGLGMALLRDNLARIDAQVGFRVDRLPRPQPIFELIQRSGGVAAAEMYRVFNMGIGFCVIVPADASVVGRVEATARAHGFDAEVIGHVIEDPAKRVFLPQHDLVGEGDTFTTL